MNMSDLILVLTLAALLGVALSQICARKGENLLVNEKRGAARRPQITSKTTIMRGFRHLAQNPLM